MQGESRGEEGLLHTSKLVGTPSGKEGTLTLSLQSLTSLLCVSGQVTPSPRPQLPELLNKEFGQDHFNGLFQISYREIMSTVFCAKIFYLPKHFPINDFWLLEFACRLLDWIPSPLLHRKETGGPSKGKDSPKVIQPISGGAETRILESRFLDS